MAERTTRTTTRTTTSGTDDPGTDALLRTGRLFTRRELSDDLRDGREGDVVYRDRWSPRQGGALHARGELHGLVLVEAAGPLPPPKQVPTQPGDITGHSRPDPARTLEEKR